MTQSVELPRFLYYNCQEPVKILETGVILPSKRIVGGISMSVWGDLGSSGPFKIAFKQAEWFKQFRPVEYGIEPGMKNPMFKDEQEWWSPVEVRFELRDVVFVMFMENAPNIIGRRKLQTMLQQLRNRWSYLYVGGFVEDPYLSRHT